MGRRKAKNGSEEAAGDDQSLHVSQASAAEEVRRRSPWMMVSITAAIGMTAIARAFEGYMAEKFALVFFLPAIVYMSDVIGTETLTLFVRELALRPVRLRRLFGRELLVGLALGSFSGVAMGTISYFWFVDPELSLTVALAVAVNGAVAVIMGMLIPVIFKRLRRDPAIGSDEILTGLSDTLSMAIYLGVATAILLS